MLKRPNTIANSFGYDHMGRKISTKENINSQGEVTLNKLVYNEIGQLKEKQLHSTNGTTFLQSTKFSYNERGWMKGSKSVEFSMKLGYDTTANAQYNGNISTQEWGSSYANKFLYTYDRLNRLTNGTSTGIAMGEALTYDVMGNIGTLGRDGGIAGTYNYTGNQLTSISSGPLATGSYAYDANGNATTDGRTGVTLTYNYLNLPQTATKTGLGLTYTYDATGQKLKKVNSATGTTTDYIDGIQYTNGAIEFIQTETGLARRNGATGSYSYEYNLTDHLGNVRYTFNEHPTLHTLQQLQADDYYAFGLRKVASAGTNNYLYNGKELKDELEQYDYGARFYDPVIGRWNVVDPLAESYQGYSPYNYALNDPIGKLDPNGMWVEIAGGYSTNNLDEIAALLGQVRSQQDDPKKKKSKGNQDQPKLTKENLEKLFGIKLSGEKVLPKVEGSWFQLWYSLNPREFEKDGLTYRVNNEGITTGLTPIGGTIEIGLGSLSSLGETAPRIIAGFTEHAAAEAAITRGFKTADIMKIVKEGEALIIRGGKQIKYTLGGNSVIIEQTGRNAGKVVTVYSDLAGSAKGLGRGNFNLKK